MNKAEWLEIGALGLGALALVVVMSRGGSAAPVTPGTSADATNQTPGYIGYNRQSDQSIPPTDLASLNNAPAQYQPGSCNCGSGGFGITFSSDNAFAKSLQATLGDIVDVYQANILSQFPDYVSQYFNNPEALAQQTVAQGQFANILAG